MITAQDSNLENLSIAQQAAWLKPRKWFGQNYAFHWDGFTFGGRFSGTVCSEESKARVQFYYHPCDECYKNRVMFFDADQNDLIFQDKVANGWIGVLGSNDGYLYAVPSFSHPNDLYEWVKEFLNA